MLARLALYLWLAADGRGISVVSVGSPDEGCPSPRQVSDALGARLPGTIAAVGPPAGANLRLTVAADASGVRVDVSDPAGAPLLHRLLPPPTRTRASDCAILADTVALIVERYWKEVGYDVPASPPPTPPTPPAPPSPPLAAPPPPPPQPKPSPPPASPPASPRRPTVASRTAPAPPPPLAAWSLGAALAGRTDPTGALDPTVQLTFATEGELGGLGTGLRLSAGVGTRTTGVTLTGTASFRRFPLRIGGYLPINTPIGRIEPGIGAGLDLITIDSVSVAGAPPPPAARAGSLCTERLCASPGVDLALGWSVMWDQHVYLRAFIRGGLAAPFSFVTENNAAVWSTPRTYLELALEAGVWFP